MGEREKRAFIRLVRLLVLGVLGAVALALAEATQGGELAINWEHIAAVAVAAAAAAVDKWVRWVGEEVVEETVEVE